MSGKNTLNFSYNASTQHKHVQYFERQYIIRLSITDYIQKGSKLHTDEINEQKQKKRDIVAYRRLQSRKEEEEDDLLQAFGSCNDILGKIAGPHNSFLLH